MKREPRINYMNNVDFLRRLHLISFLLLKDFSKIAVYVSSGIILSCRKWMSKIRKMTASDRPVV